MARRPDGRTGFTLTEIMIVISIISVLMIVGALNYARSRARARYAGCQSNLRNLSTSLEMYANEHDRKFPLSGNLTAIVGRYIQTIPTCPAAGFTTYSTGYASASAPDAYTIVCSGNNHAGLVTGSNFPQYTNAGGLRE